MRVVEALMRFAQLAHPTIANYSENAWTRICAHDDHHASAPQPPRTTSLRVHAHGAAGTRRIAAYMDPP